MTKDEINSRVHAVEVLLGAQTRYEELNEKVSKSILEEFNREPQFLDEYSDTEIVQEYERVCEDMSDATEAINKTIEEGATLEDIAKTIEEGYTDENGQKHDIYYIDLTYVNLIDVKGPRTNIRDDLEAHNPEYSVDDSCAYDIFAKALATKGIEPEDLPENVLYDILFVDNYIERKALTKEIDKNFENSLTHYFDTLKNKRVKNIISVTDIAKALQNDKEKVDDEETR